MIQANPEMMEWPSKQLGNHLIQFASAEGSKAQRFCTILKHPSYAPLVNAICEAMWGRSDLVVGHMDEMCSSHVFASNAAEIGVLLKRNRSIFQDWYSMITSIDLKHLVMIALPREGPGLGLLRDLYFPKAEEGDKFHSLLPPNGVVR